MSKVYEVMINPKSINFAPSSEVEEVLQNVYTICSTVKGSVPMERGLGIDGKVIDEPIPKFRGEYIQEVVRSVREYEPRARVSRVEFSGDSDGKVCPKVYVKLLL